MRYFRNYLTANSAYDIDISVHCDVLIFDWLMKYIHQPDTPPPLEPSSVVSILISSEFLDMEALMSTCLEYMASHLNEILRVPLDFSCLSDQIIAQLASLCPPKTLINTKVGLHLYLWRHHAAAPVVIFRRVMMAVLVCGRTARTGSSASSIDVVSTRTS